MHASSIELRKLKTLYKDLKIVDQLVSCIFLVSGDAAPVVHGNIFSFCRSLKNNGTSIIMAIITESMSIAVVKLY